MIDATITSDNHAFEFSVDATPYFESLDPQDVLDMLKYDEFGSGSYTDRLVMSLEDTDERVAAMFTMNRLIQEQGRSDDYGYCCVIDPDQVLIWVRTKSAPEWQDAVLAVEAFVGGLARD